MLATDPGRVKARDAELYLVRALAIFADQNHQNESFQARSTVKVASGRGARDLAMLLSAGLHHWLFAAQEWICLKLKADG